MINSRFNKEEVVENELKKKIKEIKEICQKEKIPMFISLCYRNTDEKSYYYDDMIGSKSNGIILKDDRFRNYVNITNGFKTILPTNDIEMLDDDFLSIDDFDKE